MVTLLYKNGLYIGTTKNLNYTFLYMIVTIIYTYVIIFLFVSGNCYKYNENV